jgi:diguanylate cyclase (GGDEF)-like protein
MAAIAEIWERSKETILGRVTVLEQAVLALLEGQLANELRRQAEREAHKLAGAIGTFGFAEGSRLARKIEQMLQVEASLEPSQVLRLSELVVALRQEVEQAATGAPEVGPVPEEASPFILVIGGTPTLAEQLQVAADGRRIRAETVSDASMARTTLMYTQPEVVVLDLTVAGDAKEGLVLLAEIAGRTPQLPVLVLTTGDSLTDRVEVARWGGRSCLQQPVSPEEVWEAVDYLLQQQRTTKTKVMVVDDDEHFLDALRPMLEPRGFKVTPLSKSLRFWDTLEETAPDVLVLDVDMPNVSGLELCRVVRNDPRWRDLPVLFLTVYTDADTVQRVFAAGADDYVTKPIIGPELVARITNRLERIRLLRRVADTDALTGLPTRHKSVQELERFLPLADRHHQPLSLALIDVDHVKQVNLRYGHATGDVVLRCLGTLLLSSFRSEDVVARWGGEEFVVGMYGMTRDQGVRRLADVLATFHREEFSAADGAAFHVTFSAGVAEYPTDGPDLQTLYRMADQALCQAKETGCHRIVSTGWQAMSSQATDRLDIVLVDDDEVLASLLLHALDTKGYRSVWLKDGQEAVEALSGSHPRLQTRIILLDVDLPGLDGLSILRRLVHDGVVQQTRVIMLTFRSAESEILAALELGAVDHVAKPFSVPILMERIRHILQV